MVITVYCGSSSGNDELYGKDAARLGKWIGENGHELVYGAGDTGLMRVIADAALDAGGEVTGVIPDVPMIRDHVLRRISKVIRVDTLPERRTTMVELADAYIALPGGTGTLDEISEIMSLNCLKMLDSPVVFFNTAGYYDGIRKFLDDAVDKGFLNSELLEHVLFSDDTEEIGEFIENWQGSADNGR